MGNVESLANYRGKSQLSGYSSTGFPGPPAPPGDGGGGMEVRIARLEAHMDHLQGDMGEVKGRLVLVEDRLGKVEAKLGEISGKISNLPGWPGLLAIAGIIIGAIGLIVRFMPAAAP